MATWTKIEDGMAKGGTAIQAALEALNSGKQENTGTVSTTLDKVSASTLSDGTVTFYRNGDSCIISGSMQIKAGMASGATILSIPQGYNPATVSQRIIAKGTGTDAVMLVLENGVLKAGSALTAGWFLTYQTPYFTNDDMPD